MTTFAVDGRRARRVWVEADIRLGLPAFTVVGLADKAVREARERVRAAMVNSGYEFPLRRITVNLAPAYLRKVGPAFDLPLAVALLVASDQLEPEAIEGCAVVGELSLTGRCARCAARWRSPRASAAPGCGGSSLPRSRAREAALVPDIEVLGIESLQRARGDAARATPSRRRCPRRLPDVGEPEADLADVRGHNGLIPGLEVAAAGGHNLFLQGPPGTGKTMIARRLPSILPPLAPDEAIEVTRIHSVAGLRGAAGLVTRAPVPRAAPHDLGRRAWSAARNPPQPGEATLAHRGVLFLDELSEFARPSLEALRQPLEDGHVTIVRGQQVMVFPTRFMLVAASNPCPCGLGGARCQCSQADLARHRRRLSGPLLDRIDILMRVERPPAEALRRQIAPTSAASASASSPPASASCTGSPASRRSATPSSPRARSARSARITPAPCACSASSTTATRSRPAATRGSSASPAPSPTSTAPTSSAPSTSTSRRASASTTRSSSRRPHDARARRGCTPLRAGRARAARRLAACDEAAAHDRVRRLPAPDGPDRGARRAAPDRVQAADRAGPRARAA